LKPINNKTEIFIEKAIKIHGDRYEYSLVNYVNNTTKIKILCKMHGVFEQAPHGHLSGHGCPECGRLSVSAYRTTSTVENFLKKAIEKHGNKYNYDKVVYKNTTTKIIITCPIHGDFEQIPDSHIRMGCKRCSEIENGKTKRELHAKEFVKKARAVHGNKYDYSKVEYYKATTPVIIICKKCGEFKTTPNCHLKGGNCPICSGMLVKFGVNDVYTLSPHLLAYFKHEDDAKQITMHTHKKVTLTCPICLKDKVMSMSDLSFQGFSCPFCSDKISLCEKIVRELLFYLKIDFIPQKMFNWSQRRQYDFYIPSKNMIIETHGEQHYRYAGRGRSLEEEQENDALKERLAKENGIENYIVVDCSKSNFEWIKTKLVESTILSILNICNIMEEDWKNIGENALSLYKIKAIDLWNLGNNVTNISKILKLSSPTISKYLRYGAEIGICNYDGEQIKKENLTNNSKNSSKKVLQYTMSGEFIAEFESVGLAMRETGASNVTQVCMGKAKSSKGFVFRYAEDSFYKYITTDTQRIVDITEIA